jgi:hypothetical protein
VAQSGSGRPRDTAKSRLGERGLSADLARISDIERDLNSADQTRYAGSSCGTAMEGGTRRTGNHGRRRVRTHSSARPKCCQHSRFRVCYRYGRGAPARLRLRRQRFPWAAEQRRIWDRRTVTVPVGAPALLWTVVVKLTGWPNTDGLALEVTVVVVGLSPGGAGAGGQLFRHLAVPAAKLLSPV